MGAKSSTPSGQQSPRSRTFSSSSTGVADTSSTAVLGAGATGHNGTEAGQGFNLLRNFAGLQVTPANSTSDRQRARSLSSMQDMHQQQQQAAGSGNMSLGGQSYGQSGNPYVGNSPGQLHPQHQQQQRHIRDSIRAMVMNGGAGNAAGAPGTRGHSHPLNIDDLSDISSSLVSSEYGITFATTGASSSSAAASGLGGAVYTATSLPAHIWSFNGIKCPVCSKFILPDDIEYHLVMCLTKPRLSYNEDVLSDAKGECVICLEDLNPGDIIARLPCLCIYHKGCIDRWFEVNRCCPEHPGD